MAGQSDPHISLFSPSEGDLGPFFPQIPSNVPLWLSFWPRQHRPDLHRCHSPCLGHHRLDAPARATPTPPPTDSESTDKVVITTVTNLKSRGFLAALSSAASVRGFGVPGIHMEHMDISALPLLNTDLETSCPPSRPSMTTPAPPTASSLARHARAKLLHRK
ncbi:hypothetical protein ZWY2020_037611 [Hordeum vulgare]|nr:hypothetical protein ZWY2020_037611 [Hordeum vulgare]